jgi:hypothetical protein
MHHPEPRTQQPGIEPKAEAGDRCRTGVPLAAVVPPHARDDVRREAFGQGNTIRAVIRRARAMTGATGLREADLVDRRL